MTYYNTTTTTTTGFYWPQCTTGYAWTYVIPDAPKEEPPKKKGRKTVNIYILFLVDAVEHEILKGPLFTIAADDSSAGAALEFTPEQRKSVTRGDYVIVSHIVGEYEAKEIAYVRNK